MLKRTCLFSTHQKAGGKLIEFGGWEMPVQYTSITDEHLAVRNAAGIFDISHMGEVTVSGAAAADFLNYIFTNDIRKISAGQGQYTLMCNDRGGVIDDLYVYCLSRGVYFLVVNASRVQDDVAWLQQQLHAFPRREEVFMTDASHNYSAVAVQGPRVKDFIDQCVAGPSNCALRVPKVTDLKKNEIGGFVFNNHDVMVSRTGYTGEDGFEVYAPPDHAEPLWNKILDAGKTGTPTGVLPCGLAARNTLRLEAGMALYGNELDESTTLLEANLGWICKLDKGDFIGREALARQKAEGVKRKLAGFEIVERGIARDHQDVVVAGQRVGTVTSGSPAPFLKKNIGFAYLPIEFASVGQEIQIDVRGKLVGAQVVKAPFYKRAK